MPPSLATCGPRNGGDPEALAAVRFAIRLFLLARVEALRAADEDGLECRAWLMSPDGAAFMIELGLDPCATQARLLAEWARAGMRRVIGEK